MRERPIIFSAAMVRAILEGRKTQTRRTVRWPERMLDDGLPPEICYGYGDWGRTGVGFSFYVAGTGSRVIECPYGKRDDCLWVRETWRKDDYAPDESIYRADAPADVLDATKGIIKWIPAIHMPRVRARIVLQITKTHVERVQEITRDDELAEGVADGQRFDSLWDSINGERAPWALNPWVWALTFKVVTP